MEADFIMPKRKIDQLYEVTATVDGKRKHFYGHTAAEAKAKREQYVEMHKRCPLARFNISLEEWLAAWVDTMRMSVAETTYRSYRNTLKYIIGTPLGKKRLEDLRPSMFQQRWQELLDAGLSPRTVIYCHTVTSSALKQAVFDGALPSNPLLSVRRPRNPKKQAKALSEMQVHQLLSVIQNPRYLRLIRFALATGMRREEILGQTISGIDFSRKTVSVTQTVVIIDKDHVIVPTAKTSSSLRTITVDDQTMQDIRDQLAYLDEQKRSLGSAYFDNDLLFPAPDGRPLSPTTVTHQVKAYLREAGLGEFSMHSLRHTHATMLLKAGIHFKIVQYRLGHSTFGTTMDVYSHVTPEMDQSAVVVIGDAFRKMSCAPEKTEKKQSVVKTS